MLRSRRLAAFLLVGMTAYSWVATLVPLGPADAAAVAAWDARHPLLAVLVKALWLHRAYSSPVFIAIALLLTTSTTACAWERTREAVRAWRGRGKVSRAAVERLKRSPTAVVDVRDASDRRQALTAAAGALRGMRMRVRQGPALVEGSSGAVGHMGSPLFHWALVGLFVFAGLGQLMRYEGYANVLVGDSITDARDSYAQGLDVGPLADGAFTGLTMTVKELDGDYVAAGVPRGATPFVALGRDGAVVREQWVYSNNPLRHGSLLIHSGKTGPAFVGTVRVAGKEQSERVVLYHELDAASTAGFGLPDPATNGVLAVEVTPVPGRRVAVVVVRGGTRTETQTAGVGESATLYDGATLSVDALAVYAQLHVVNDWSVPWVYATFVFGCIAAVVMVFVPPRTVRVMAVGPGERSGDGVPKGQPHGVRLHVVIVRRGSDPAFPRRAVRTLRDALAGETAASHDEEAGE